MVTEDKQSAPIGVALVPCDIGIRDLNAVCIVRPLLAVVRIVQWTLRFLSLVSVCILLVTPNAVWPDFHPFRWMDLASVVTLGVTKPGLWRVD